MKNDWYRRLRTVLLAWVLLSSLFTASCNFETFQSEPSEKKTTTSTTWNQPNEDTNEDTSQPPSSKELPTILPIYVLSVNDLHGYIMRDKEGRNGLSNMAYLINQIRDADDYDNVILIGNGDMFQGTYISNETNGLAVIDAMNAMKFDAMGIGNHEFDWGIDVILKYFDGDPNNGEANFPLLNANIYVKASNSLLTVKDGKVFESYIVEREGIKIGLISYIGDLYNSIIYSMVKDYEFDLNLSDSIERIGRSLKQAGADIIVVNIHYGDEYNKIFAQAKDEQGNYLVDAVINGHEHKLVQDVVERDGGIPMPYVQAGSNGKYIGKITLYFNTETRSVIDYDVEYLAVADAGLDYDESVEAIIDHHWEKLENMPLIEAGETIVKREQLFQWIGHVMLKATGSNIAIHNIGGVRGSGHIVKGEDVTVAQVFEISPFDNPIYVFEATYEEVQQVIDNNSLFSVTKTPLKQGQTYQVAVISYVYENYSEMSTFRRNGRGIDTGLYIRDLLVMDLQAKNRLGLTFKPYSEPEAHIEQLWFHPRSFIHIMHNSTCLNKRYAV